MANEVDVRGAPVRTGQVLAGKYLVQRVLGVGGMGVVVQAMHLELEQLVAVKFMLPSVAADSKSVSRFLREARAAARLQSHHVARVMDVGRLDTGEPYQVMEYLEGSDLAAVLDASGRLEVSRAVDWMLQACEAIAEAHAVGIVHRDLKPSNLFVIWRADGDAFVKVLDFGISKLLKRAEYRDETSTMTSPWAILGSPAYMSPEQLRSSKDVDHRSDIWSLGIILFELLTGRHAFHAESLPGIIAAISSDPAPSVRRVRPDVPKEIDYLIARTLEKEPERRLPDLAEFALGLAPFGSVESERSTRRIVRVLRKAGMTAKPSTAPGGRGNELPSLFDAFDTPEEPDDIDGEADTVHAPLPEGLQLADQVVVQTGSPLHITARSNPRRWSLLIAGMVALTVLSGVVTFELLGSAGETTMDPLEAFSSAPSSSSNLALPPPGESFPFEQLPTTVEPMKSGPIAETSPPRRGQKPGGSASTPAPATALGFLNVVCVPACSKVLVDGKSLGSSPVLKVELAGGFHQVDAVMPSGLRRSFQVEITSGATTSRRVVFTAGKAVATIRSHDEQVEADGDMFDNPYGATADPSGEPPESQPPSEPSKPGAGESMYLPENPF